MPILTEHLDCLAFHLMSRINDFSIEPQAKAISHYLLDRFNLNQCKLLLNKPNAPQYIHKLLNSESAFMGVTPRSIGIDLVVGLFRDTIQSSLNVKHLKIPKTETSMKQIIPIISDSILYSHPNFIWIRYYSKTGKEFTSKYRNVKITDNVFEIYIKKQKQKSEDQHIYENKKRIVIRTKPHDHTVARILSLIDENVNYYLIFCSELISFIFNPQLFISNYIKFNFCYRTSNPILELNTFDEYKSFLKFLLSSMMFADRKNLSIMGDYSHGPLIKYTGDNPQNELSKCNFNEYYTNEGTRAMLSLGKSSDLGTISNYIETVGEIIPTIGLLNNII